MKRGIMNMANQVVDVSTFQQTIDWSQVRQGGIAGAMIRSGYGFSTVDDQYRANVAGCENNGISYGMYHYSYAANIEDAKKEAEFFIHNAKGTSPSYPLAMDVEEASQAAMGKDALTSMILAFCDMVKAAGYQPMLYTNLNWANYYIDMSQIDNAGIRVWIAQYNTTLDYKGNYFLWQYTNSGRVAGIPTNVDLNYLGSDMGEIAPQPPITDNHTYIVKAGDTLWDIAQSQLGNGSRYKEIMALNGLTSDIIQPGQVLKLPTGNNNTGSGSASMYTVKAGDTLWDIAQTQLGNGSRYKEITALNGLTNNIIQPGQILKLPVGNDSDGSGFTSTYTVKTGDTLWDIAQKLLGNGTRYKELVSLNNLHSNIIYPGQVLKIPE